MVTMLDYTIVSAKDCERLGHEVAQLLALGWDVYGDLAIHDVAEVEGQAIIHVTRFYQPMVKYSEEL